VNKPRKRFEVVPLSHVRDKVRFSVSMENKAKSMENKAKTTAVVETGERKLILERDAADISERVFCGSRHNWSE